MCAPWHRGKKVQMIFSPHMWERVNLLLKQFFGCIMERAKWSAVLSAARKCTVLSATPNSNPCLHQLFDHLPQYGAVSLCMFLLPAEKKGQRLRTSNNIPKTSCKTKTKKHNFYFFKNTFEERNVASDFGLFQIFHIKPRLLSRWVTM